MSDRRLGRDLIGANLSLEYGDCSNAAQALEHSAADLMRHALHTNRLREVSGVGETRQVEVLTYIPGLRDRPNGAVNLDAGEGLTPGRLLLASEDISGAVRLSRMREQVLGRLLRKHVRYERYQDNGPERIGARPATHSKLLLCLEGEVAVPLAQFRKTEEGGACGYVQLGQGVSDTELHSVPADDVQPSFAQIEAIRALLSGELTKDSHQLDIIRKLANEQLKAHSNEVDQALEEVLVERVFDRFAANKKQERLVMANGHEGRSYASTAQTASWAEELLLLTGQRVELKLVQESAATSDELQLCAVIRNDVAVPLARFSQREGTLELAPNYAAMHSRSSFVRGMLRQDATSIRTNKFKELRYAEYQDEIRYILGDKEIDDTLKILARKNLYSGTCKQIGHTEEYVREVNRAFAQPDIYTADSFSESAVNGSLSRLVRRDLWLENKLEYYRVLAGKYNALPGVIDTVKAFTGETTPAYEHLIDRLHWILDGKKKASLFGVAEDIQAGKTIISSDVVFEVQRNNNTYEVRIWGKPTARDKEAPVLLAEGFYNPVETTPVEHETAKAMLDILDLIEK